VQLEDLANLGEFVSALVVLGSFVYLAIQMRQNTQAIRAENYARALDRISAMQAQMSRDVEFSAFVSTAVADPARLSPGDRIRFAWLMYEMFGAFEFLFLQAQHRTLPAEVWARWSATTAWWLSWPGMRAVWAARPAPFTASFTAFIDACIRENPADAAASGRFQDFVSGAARRVE
jgi:hypothetical protein